MSDYVTKDAVQRVITNSAAKLYMTGQISKEESPKLVAYILSAVERMPGIDVVERKHGKWEEVADPDDIYVECECSECNKRFNKVFGGKPLQWKPYNFCPNCGADMRQKDGET